jgi:hypothetical protein
LEWRAQIRARTIVVYDHHHLEPFQPIFFFSNTNILQTSKDNIARDALQRYLARTRFRTLQSKLVPRAVNQGIYTDEDVFRKIAHPHDDASTSGSASL